MFDHKMKDYPNTNNSSSLKTDGSVHNPSVNPSQTYKGAKTRNTQVVGSSGATQASGQRILHTLML